MTVEVELRDAAKADFNALEGKELKLQALRFLLKLKTAPFLGLPLEARAMAGDLSDCRKIYFAETENQSPTHRIVYRLLPDVKAPTTADVIVIGQREGLEVYREALARLGRTPPSA